MNLQSGEEVVKTGTFLYDGTVTCDVRIVRRMIRAGSGDWEDPPELANDLHGEFYVVQYGSTTARGHFNAQSGGGTSMQEAIASAEAMPGIGRTIQWTD
jgi:hypothetical protein